MFRVLGIYYFGEKVKMKPPHSVFPFTYFGKTYDSCTKDDMTGSYAQYSWCATKVDSDGNMIKSGVCDPDCPGVGKKLSETYSKF